MSVIKISELHSAGTAFFQDTESYLSELRDCELDTIIGSGKYQYVITSVLNVYSQASVSNGISLQSISYVTAF